jgi:hypothetical protein
VQAKTDGSPDDPWEPTPEALDGDGNEVDAHGRLPKPKWMLPDTNDSRLMRAFRVSGGRKHFKQGEKTRWKAIRQGVLAGTINEAWVDNCLTYAEEKQSMAFPDLMTWISNHDKMMDWLQRQAPKQDKAHKANSLPGPEEF